MNPNEYVMGSTTFYSTGPEDKPADKPATTTNAPTTNTPTTSNQTTQANNPPATQPSALSNDWKFLDDPRFKDLPGTQAYRNFALGKGFTGNLLPDTLKNFKFFGQSPESVQQYIEKGLEKQITPQTAQKALTDQYQKAQQEKLFNSYFRTDAKGNTFPTNPNIKMGTKGYGGATFGLNTFYSRAYSDRVAKTQGAGLWSIGIDPKDPNAEALATAWIEKHMNQSTGPGTPWSKILGSGKWGREDAKMPGLQAMRQQYPKASNLALLDASVRMTHSQAALAPREFDVMDVLDPIIEFGLNFVPGVGPIASRAYAFGRGASEGNWLGAAMGAISPTSDLPGLIIRETANIPEVGRDLSTALSFGRSGLQSINEGSFSPLLRKGASYALSRTLPYPYGPLAGFAVENVGRQRKS